MWSDENSHETKVTNFQRTFSVNVWCGLLGNSLTATSVFQKNSKHDTHLILIVEWAARFAGGHPTYLKRILIVQPMRCTCFSN